MSWATRLINFRARWYDSETGRWLSNDPIGISGGLNQYASCGNNPVSFVDPFGLFVNVENSIVNPQSPCAWEVGTKYSVDAATVGLTFGIYAVIAASVYGGAVAAPHAGRFLTQGHTFRTLRFFRMRHGPWGNSYELMRWKNILRLEAHPTARWMPRWMFRPHGHIDFLGEAIRKLHIPIIEPILAYFGYKAITSDETGSSVEKSVK